MLAIHSIIAIAADSLTAVAAVLATATLQLIISVSVLSASSPYNSHVYITDQVTYLAVPALAVPSFHVSLAPVAV